MEQARALTRDGFTMETLYDALRDRVRERIRKETIEKAYRYEGTARIREESIGYHELEDFTL
ncbi:MAG: hypothetical protein ACM337_04655 [Syntrophaceae bacterium]